MKFTRLPRTLGFLFTAVWLLLSALRAAEPFFFIQLSDPQLSDLQLSDQHNAERNLHRNFQISARISALHARARPRGRIEFDVFLE
jgi:hypothetical protein